MVTKDEILSALTGIAGPDRRTQLVGSSALSGINVREGKVSVAIEVQPDEAAGLEDMRGEVEAALRKVPGVDSVLVTLTGQADRRSVPSQKERVEESMRAHRATGTENNAIPGIRKIIAVASGKGGVGKSTTACNLALALARRGLKVGVLDADLYGPSMPRLFGINAKPEMADDGHSLMPLEKYGVKVMSIGFLVEDDAAIVWRGPMIMSGLTQLLRDVAWGELDVLVVDMPPGTGDAQLTMAQAVPLAGAVVVSTPQDIALIDARRGVTMFQQVKVPLLGIVENMSYFVCPHCGGRSDIFAHGGARQQAERLNVPFLGEVPLDIGIREASDEGRPIVMTAPESALAAAYVDLAERVWTTLQESVAKAKPMPKIVMG